MHRGSEDHVVAPKVSLRLVKGGVHVLDRFGETGARGIPNNDADARVLLDLKSRDVVGLGDDADQAFGENLGFLR